MTYRSDVDALSARAAALEAEVASKTRERDAVKQMLDEAHAVRPPAPARRGSRVEIAALVVLGLLIGVGAWVVSHDWPLQPEPAQVVVPEVAPHSGPPRGFAQPEPPPSSLPVECEHYREAIQRLSTCEKLPAEARQALWQGFDQAARSWVTLPPESRPQLAAACAAGADAVYQAARATCP